jgi:outer membrane lipoprotein SlyB
VRKSVLMLTATSVLLAGCVQSGANLAADAYQANQVNQRQEAKGVNILMVRPAKVEVDNGENQRTAQLVGGLLGAGAGLALGGGLSHRLGGYALGGAGGAAAGAAAGSLVPGRVLVDGVSLTYEEDGHTFNSAQVGKLCEFQPGRAIVISTGPGVTRIQPNAGCPVAAK